MSTTLTPTPGTTPTETDALAKRSIRPAIVMVVVAALALFFLGLRGEAGATSTFGLSIEGQGYQLSPLAVPSRGGAIVASLIALALAAVAFAMLRADRKVPLLVQAGYGLGLAAAFLTWAIAGDQISLVGLLQGSLLLAVPLVFGSLAGVLSERAGVVNIAIEGQLLAGAFLSATVASLTQSIALGLLAAIVAGVLVGALLAVFAIRYVVDQIIVGVVINTLIIGVTSFLYTSVLAPNQDVWNSPPVLRPIAVPVLSEIPILGPVMFRQSLIVYLMYVIVALVHVALFRTRWGLRVRAVGEHPKAADTVGIDVNKMRFRNVLLGGAVAGLGGAYFTLGAVGAFGKEMTAGKGFIALAAMIFGRWSPLGALAAALLFGFADNLQSVLSIVGTPIPSEVMLMAPYLATLFAVAGLVGKVRAPAADGVPYVK